MSDLDERAERLFKMVYLACWGDFPLEEAKSDARALLTGIVEELGITSEMVELIHMEATEAFEATCVNDHTLLAADALDTLLRAAQP